jgi:cell envelope-related function transcriptional attenuator common domain
LLVLCLMPILALAAPNPIEPLDYDSLPDPVPGQHHYLLLCVDQWAAKPTNLGNTDGIVMVTLDTRAKRIMLTSCIRDLLVLRPDGVIGRINYIAKSYSPEELCKIFSTHFGVKVEKYILFGMDQIQAIIDQLGGVDITVTAAEANYLKRYAISPTSTKPAMNRAGLYKMTGHAAVIYMRIRKVGGGGDMMRTQRVRTVLSTLADQCRNITKEDATALVDSISQNTALTNISLQELLEAMEMAMQLRGVTVEEIRMPVDGAYEPISYAGMAVQQADFVKCREAMADYIENSFLVIDD